MAADITMSGYVSTDTSSSSPMSLLNNLADTASAFTKNLGEKVKNLFDNRDPKAGVMAGGKQSHRTTKTNPKTKSKGRRNTTKRRHRKMVRRSPSYKYSTHL